MVMVIGYGVDGDRPVSYFFYFFFQIIIIQR